jgi:hypothetical protein
VLRHQRPGYQTKTFVFDRPLFVSADSADGTTGAACQRGMCLLLRVAVVARSMTLLLLTSEHDQYTDTASQCAQARSGGRTNTDIQLGHG